MVLQDYSATIESILVVSPTIRVFTLRLDKELQFRAGQFMNLIFEDAEQKFVRPYSLASSPDHKDYVEFAIKLVDTGRATPHLWHKKVGDVVKLKGPSGSFVFQHNSHDKVFIGSGTGIAPLRSMILDALTHGNDKRFVLIVGTRSEEEILFKQELENLAGKYANFSYLPVVSRPSSSWQGLTGHVQDHIPSGLDMKNTDFYLCGLPVMVEETKQKLLSLGVPESCIMHEKF